MGRNHMLDLFIRSATICGVHLFDHVNYFETAVAELRGWGSGGDTSSGSLTPLIFSMPLEAKREGEREREEERGKEGEWGGEREREREEMRERGGDRERGREGERGGERERGREGGVRRVQGP